MYRKRNDVNETYFKQKLVRIDIRELILRFLGYNSFINYKYLIYFRYTQDPKELWDWFEDYLDDEEVSQNKPPKISDIK